MAKNGFAAIDPMDLQLLIDKANDATDLSWQEIVDSLGIDISKDNFRKELSGEFGAFAMMEYLQENNPTESNEEFRRIKDELYKERQKLYDQRREYNKLLREEARFEHLTEILLESLNDLPELRFGMAVSNGSMINEAALLFSDIHYGLTIDSPLNFYNTQIARERIVQLTEKTINYCRNNQVGKLHLCVLGDCISGLIHQSVRCEQEEDVVTQLMEFSEILSQMICRLREEIPEIIAYSTWGNHSRIISSKKDSLNRENLERLVPFYLKNRVPNDVRIIDSHGTDYIEATIGGFKTVLEHGDKSSATGALNNWVRVLGYVPQQVFMGHTHDYNDKDDCDVQVTVNGSVCGTDEYALSLRKNTKPCQVLKIYSEDVCTYKIIFDI